MNSSIGTDGKRRIDITGDEAFSVCKAGQKEKCCIFLGMDKVGFCCMKNDESEAETLQHVIDGKKVNMTVHQYLEMRAKNGESNAKSLGGKERGHEGCWWDE